VPLLYWHTLRAIHTASSRVLISPSGQVDRTTTCSRYRSRACLINVNSTTIAITFPSSLPLFAALQTVIIYGRYTSAFAERRNYGRPNLPVETLISQSLQFANPFGAANPTTFMTSPELSFPIRLSPPFPSLSIRFYSPFSEAFQTTHRALVFLLHRSIARFLENA